MKYSLIPYHLHLKHEFGLSRNRRTHVAVVFLKMEHDGIVAWGECSPNPRYNETVESSIQAISKEIDAVQEFSLDAMRRVITALSRPGFFSAAAAVDLMMWDYVGKKMKINLRKLWNLPSKNRAQNTFTIGIDSEDVLKMKLEEAHDFPLLKIKMGTDTDRELIEFIGRHTPKPLLVDANEGWKSVDVAIERLKMLESFSVLAIEQPMPKDMDEAMIEVKSISKFPLIADESISLPFSMEAIAKGFHGINIKLMKTGGLTEAFQQLWKARNCGLKVMIGCMIESSLGNTAASIFASLCDFSDVDSFLLIDNDPVSGLVWDNQAVAQASDAFGLGVEVNLD